MNRSSVSGVGASALAGLLVAGCSPTWYAERADAEVDALLEGRTEEVLGDREEWVIPAEPAKPEEPGAAAAPAQLDDQADGRPIDLQTALRVAVQHNRDYQNRREDLFLQGLAVTRARFDFGPQIEASVTPVYADRSRVPSDSDVLGNVALSQILPSGGTLSATSAVSGDDWGKAFLVSLSQPVLRNFGYEVSHEALTQAERNVVYEIRDFELFRQDFSIAVASAYFALITLKRTVANEEANYRQAVFDRDKAEALFRVDRNDEQDIFRSRRRSIEANDSYLATQATYRASVDQFKILMGLPTSTAIRIVDQDPPFRPVDLDLDAAVAAAKHNRLDLMTSRDVIEDAERQVRIASNQLLPDVDVALTGGYDDALGTSGEAAWTVGASVTAELPLQRLPERNTYRASLIALERAERIYSLQLDQLEVDIRDQLRQMRSVEQRIALQQEQIAQEQRAVTVSEIRYEAGDIENRDLLDARQSLVDAQNELIRLQADHFIRSMRLMRDLGVLFVDDNGEMR